MKMTLQCYIFDCTIRVQLNLDALMEHLTVVLEYIILIQGH